jgi:hypothetical protein
VVAADPLIIDADDEEELDEAVMLADVAAIHNTK